MPCAAISVVGPGRVRRLNTARGVSPGLVRRRTGRARYPVQSRSEDHDCDQRLPAHCVFRARHFDPRGTTSRMSASDKKTDRWARSATERTSLPQSPTRLADGFGARSAPRDKSSHSPRSSGPPFPHRRDSALTLFNCASDHNRFRLGLRCVPVHSWCEVSRVYGAVTLSDS